MHDDDNYFVCPNCGAEVVGDASFCRECGASDDSGWEADDVWSEDDFDYEDFLSREFPEQASPTASEHLRRTAVITVVLLLCLALILAMIL